MNRNVSFYDGYGNDVGGMFQNGSLSWADMQLFMHMTFISHYQSYAVFSCKEPIDLQDITKNRGPMTMMNEEKIIPGNYVVLSMNGLYALLALSSQLIKLNRCFY